MNILKLKKAKGFTLVELLVVISIISFLSSIVLASVQSARDKAKAVQIAEDLRQVKIASELYFADNQTYKFEAFGDKQNFLAGGNTKISSLKDLNVFSIKKADAAVNSAACNLFNIVAGILVNGKYLSRIPVHPYQDPSKGICYKAVQASDDSYFVAYGETPTNVLVGGVSVPKNTGFVVGDTSLPTLKTIYALTKDENGVGFPATASGEEPNSISDIVDNIEGITSGSEGTSGGSGGINMPTMYTLSINPNNATAFYVNNVTPSDFLPKKYVKGTILYLLAYKDASPASSWTGGCDNGAGGQGDGSSCVVTMNSDKSMAPVFTTAYTLTVEQDPFVNYLSLSKDSYMYPPTNFVSGDSFPNGTNVNIYAYIGGDKPVFTGCNSTSWMYDYTVGICNVTISGDTVITVSKAAADIPVALNITGDLGLYQFDIFKYQIDGGPEVSLLGTISRGVYNFEPYQISVPYNSTILITSGHYAGINPDSWSGCTSSVTSGCTINNVTSDKSVYANFTSVE